MALADIYVLTDVQVANGSEEFLNVYTYQRNSPEGSAAGLAAAFIQDVQLSIEALQGLAIEHTLTRVFSLGNLEDFAEVTQTGNNGTANGELLPLHDAANFTLRAASRAVRPGSKRISGLIEVWQSGGVFSSVDFLNVAETLRLALFAEIESPVDQTLYSPVIVKRVPYVTPGGNNAYRWPQAGDPLVAPIVTGALLDVRVSHQVSRGNAR